LAVTIQHLPGSKCLFAAIGLWLCEQIEADDDEYQEAYDAIVDHLTERMGGQLSDKQLADIYEMVECTSDYPFHIPPVYRFWCYKVATDILNHDNRVGGRVNLGADMIGLIEALYPNPKGLSKTGFRN
jgi:hypothetical protein